jgi:hypothetical protein
MSESRRKVSKEIVEKRRNQPLSSVVKEKIDLVAQMLPEETDWLRVKKSLMLELAPADRQLFSKRHDVTKKHPPFNVFEKLVRDAWRAATGKELVMPPEKVMEDVEPESYL